MPSLGSCEVKSSCAILERDPVPFLARRPDSPLSARLSRYVLFSPYERRCSQLLATEDLLAEIVSFFGASKSLAGILAS